MKAESAVTSAGGAGAPPGAWAGSKPVGGFSSQPASAATPATTQRYRLDAVLACDLQLPFASNVVLLEHEAPCSHIPAAIRPLWLSPTAHLYNDYMFEGDVSCWTMPGQQEDGQ